MDLHFSAADSTELSGDPVSVAPFPSLVSADRETVAFTAAWQCEDIVVGCGLSTGGASQARRAVDDLEHRTAAVGCTADGKHTGQCRKTFTRAKKGQKQMIVAAVKSAFIITSVVITASLVTYSANGAINRTQTSQVVGPTRIVRYPTMLDMTFPEFEAAVQTTDIVLLPIGAIEEHSSHLPLGTDAMNATAQLFEVKVYLRSAGFDTIMGPPLNIGITNEGGDWTRDGTYAYPGSRPSEGIRSSLSTSTCCGPPRQRLASRVSVRRAPRHSTCRSRRAGRRRGKPQDQRHDRVCNDRQRMLERMKLAPSPHPVRSTRVATSRWSRSSRTRDRAAEHDAR